MLTTALIAALRLLDGIKIALHSESSVFASSNGSFIGDGAGGLLPKLGWDLNDFNNFVNRSETDTAWESYQRHKRDEQNSGTPAPSTSQKRSSEDDHNGGRAKRSRAPGEQNGDGERDQYSLLVPVNPAVPPLPANGLYAPSSSRSQEAIFNDLMRGSSGSPMFVPPTPPSNGQFSSQSTSSVAPNHSPYQTSYAPPINVNVDSALPSMSLINNSGAIPTSRSQSSSSQQPKPTQSTTSPADDDQDPKRHEAYKLIQYHLDNYKRNSAYCLPSSLRPTLVQRTVPHESVIDSILHPELRDRMILLRGRFDLVDCLHDYRTAITIHGDDVLAHNNWEISETWLLRYKYRPLLLAATFSN
ncbi:hypothetical protein EW026_g3643 [Hermanssonia centrifuga]|uniref:Uncharacterized protein n=1 Tax=Hermanssonia centrifuga TaxID=98765 RepID=A0A4S4KP67_9APHY|nr:hypothetical protein EW026_g3643 [Hermanssonia centrifuga]